MRVDPDAPDALQQLIREAAGRADAEARYESFLVSVVDVAVAAQKRVTLSCNAFSPTVLHLLLFNALQVFITCHNIKAFMVGFLSRAPLTYYWFLAIAFHVLCGFVLMGLVLACATQVTDRAARVPKEVVGKLHAKDACYMRIALVAGMLTRRVSGFHIFGEPVALGKAFPFLFAGMLMLFSTLCDILDEFWQVFDSPGWIPVHTGTE